MLLIVFRSHSLGVESRWIGLVRVEAMLAAFCAAAIDQICQERKNREIKDGVDADGDSQKPAEGPGERGMRLRHDQLGDFEAGRKQQD